MKQTAHPAMDEVYLSGSGFTLIHDRSVNTPQARPVGQ